MQQHRHLLRLIALFWLWLAWIPNSWAHDVPSSALLLDVGDSTVQVELHLPLNELTDATDWPLMQHPELALTQYRAALRQYVLDHVYLTDTQQQRYSVTATQLTLDKTDNPNWTSNDWLVATLHFQRPTSTTNTARNFILHCDTIVHHVVTHKTLVSLRHDFVTGLVASDPKVLGVIAFQQYQLPVQLETGSWWQGLRSVIDMGMQHIAAGSDHLLFLLTLLLPAPLLASRRRWRHTRSVGGSVLAILKTVSGFTLGHSFTLALATLGWITVPSQPIEILIAISIIVSAVHAWRPIFAGKEMFIAGGFGLIHGLAFASALQGFNYETKVLTSTLLGFNLGVELMQIMVVTALLPTLIWWSRRPHYVWLRHSLAALAFIAAIMWVGERAFSLPNPLNPIFSWLTTHAVESWLIWLLISTLACLLPQVTSRTTPSKLAQMP